MGVTNGVIVKPLSVTDVKQVLGVASNDVGYLCGNGHGKINMYAKYKPVVYASNKGLSEEERASARYGMHVQAVDTSDIGTDCKWYYEAPTGGASAPYRLGDFVGYDHDCETPLSVGFPASLEIDGANTWWVDLDADLALPDNNLLVKDIYNAYLDWYPGIMVYNKTKNQTYYRTYGVTLADFGNGFTGSVPLVDNTSKGDEIDLYFILSPYDHNSDTDFPPMESCLYVVDDSGTGMASVTVSGTASVTPEIALSGDVSISYTYDSSNEVYNTYMVTGNVQNTAQSTANVYFKVAFENWDYGNIYETPKSALLSIAAGGSRAFSIDCELEVDAADPWYEVQVYTIDMNGVSTLISSGRYYNFETKTWSDENPWGYDEE